MKKTRVLLGLGLLVLLLSMALTGCDSVLGLVFKPDLTVTSVEPLKNLAGEITAVRLVVANEGIVSAEPATYAIVMSADTTISIAADTVVWEDTVELAAGEEKQIDVSGPDQINQWMADHGVTDIPAGNYYLGVFIDPDDRVAEKDETNNEGASDVSFEMTAGGAAQGTTITVELTGAGDLDGKSFMYGVFDAGADPATVGPLAIGDAVVSGGVAEALAQTYDPVSWGPTGTWYGTVGQMYDLNMMVDMNGDGDFQSFIDYSRGAALTVTMDADGVYQSVTRDEFYVSALPAVFGVYSESHDVYVVPIIDSQNCTVNSDNSEVATYDGTAVIKVTYNGDSQPTWMHFNYSPPPDMSASTNLVLAVDSSAASVVTSVDLLLWSSASSASGVSINWSTGTYRTATGQGSGTNWDTFSIPIADFAADFDPTDLTSISIGYSGLAAGEIIYFDDIHFE